MRKFPSTPKSDECHKKESTFEHAIRVVCLTAILVVAMIGGTIILAVSMWPKC